jgi:hypothetical protein
MGKLLDEEKPKQIAFKINSPYFSEGARADGEYKNHTYPFCLPREYAQENLFHEIRQSAQDYFTRFSIKWHDGHNGMPSNHLCDSQVCCVNFLFPFADKPKPLAELLSVLYPTLKQMLPLENGQYVAIEWIGQKNYLGERKSKNRKRTRGANFTSADAAVMFENTDGSRQIALIEWKYTESYYSTNLKIAKSGTDRSLIYAHLYDRDDEVLDKEKITSFDDLFYEPFYQLMRQQYLANEMEIARELDADIVSLLHIAPSHNKDFKRITSLRLKRLGQSATEVWSKLVKKPNRFISVSTEDLFGKFNTFLYKQKWFYKFLSCFGY